LEPNAPQAETSESFWFQIAFYAFAALLIGAAVMLAFGGAPAWAEWIAVVILWSLVSLAYFAIALRFLLLPALALAGVQGRKGDRKGPRFRSVIEYCVGRLVRLLFAVALFVSGRPVLASLYLFLFLWVPLVFAVLACLTHAGIWIKQPLRKALGLPRGLVYLLYAKPCRRVWKQVLPTGFWLVATVLALGLAFDALPMAAEEAITAILWGTALALLALSGLSFLFLVFVEDGGNVVHGKPPFDWPRAIGFYAQFLQRLVFLSALCWAGLWILAGLYLALICVVSAIEWYGTLNGDQDDEILNPSILTGVTGLLLLFGPFLVLVSPVYLPILAYEFWCKIRTAKDLRGKFGKPDGLIYFLYSEPHQYEHFLGEGGVLAAYGEQVVARNWRTCIRPAREGPGWEDFEESAEGRLLKHFEISRLRHHLPFVAVVPPSPWLKGFQMSKVYRARRRDNGRALRKLEEQIKKAVSKAFGIAAS